jgi:hypothetical protein
MMVKMQNIFNQISNLVPVIEAMPPTVIDGVVKELEERAIGAGTVTIDGLEKQLESVLARSGVLGLLSEIRQQKQPMHPIHPIQAPESFGFQSYNCGGAYHRVPEDFDFPNAGPLTCWKLWCLGDTVKMYPPNRTLKPVDVPKSIRKRLSGYRFLMNYLEDHLKERNIFKINPTLEEVNQMLKSQKRCSFSTRSLQKRERDEKNKSSGLLW